MKCTTDHVTQLNPAPAQLPFHTYWFTFYFAFRMGFPPLKSSLDLRRGHAAYELLGGERGGAERTARTWNVLRLAGED